MEVPAVAFAREINPLWMAKFVTHKIQVATVSCRKGNEANHLMLLVHLVFFEHVAYERNLSLEIARIKIN